MRTGPPFFAEFLLELVQYGEYRRRVICVTIEQPRLYEDCSMVTQITLTGYGLEDRTGELQVPDSEKKIGGRGPRRAGAPASPSPGKSGTGTGTGPRPGPATRAPGPAGAASPARGVSAPWRQPTASEAEALMQNRRTVLLGRLTRTTDTAHCHGGAQVPRD